jgi:hypothetical protein
MVLEVNKGVQVCLGLVLTLCHFLLFVPPHPHKSIPNPLLYYIAISTFTLIRALTLTLTLALKTRIC